MYNRLTVKHGGGRSTVWACAASSGSEQLAVIDGMVEFNSLLKDSILKENVQTSVVDLELQETWVIHLDSDPMMLKTYQQMQQMIVWQYQ